MSGSRPYLVLPLLAMSLAAGCAARRFAVNRIGDALAAGGTIYESDEDIELVGDALPFGLKLIESLVAESPRHRGLLLAGCRGFTLYAYAYVQQDADRVAQQDVDRGNELRERARKLYLRASKYGTRALELSYPGFQSRLERDPVQAAKAVKKRKHVPARQVEVSGGFLSRPRNCRWLARGPVSAKPSGDSLRRLLAHAD